MIPLSIYLAGMSFVIALIACVIAIAEHHRAERVERSIARKQSETIAMLAGVSDNVTRLVKNLDLAVTQIQQQDAMIRAVAAASVPPAIPVGQVHIVVPGPRTQQ